MGLSGSGTGQHRLLPLGKSWGLSQQGPEGVGGWARPPACTAFPGGRAVFPEMRGLGWPSVGDLTQGPAPSDLGLAPRPGRLGPWSHLPVCQLPWEKPGHSN